MMTLARTTASIVLVVLLAAGATGPVAVGQSEPSASPLAEREVFGFLPYWELARADGIDLDTLTTLAWFGVEAGRDGRLIRESAAGEPTPGWAGWTSEDFAAVRERAEAAGVRVVLTVERFSWSTAGRRHTRKLLGDPEARATLAQEIVGVISESGVDGVNLDFEPLPAMSRGDFVRLVREVRAALDAVDPGLQLTFDLTPDVKSFPLRRLVADGAADAAVLMGYEYRTPGSREAGSVAPLSDPDPDALDLRESVRLALARAPAERLILALPWYGRAWSTKTDETASRTRRGERFLDPSNAVYRVSVPRAASAGRNYDREQASAWSVYPSRACDSCPESPRQLWYDDPDSVLAKVGLARRKGLRGVGIWALGYQGERPELWSALRFGLERRSDDTAPVGAATIAAASILGEHDGSPLVGETATIDLSASDGVDGSGVAFVRVATRGRLAADGSLKRGTTFPAVDSVTVAMPHADPVDEVFAPGATVDPDPSPEPGETETEVAARTIRVQWRDIAGNWSAPITLPVVYQPPS